MDRSEPLLYDPLFASPPDTVISDTPGRGFFGKAAVKKALFILVLLVFVGGAIAVSFSSLSQDRLEYAETTGGAMLSAFRAGPDDAVLIVDTAGEDAGALAGQPVTAVRQFAVCGNEVTAFILIGKHTVELPNTAFYDCAALAAVLVDPENPALASVDGVLYRKKNGRLTELVLYPAQNGLYRALLALGEQSRNIAVLAEENGAEFRASALADGVALEAISVPGRIRENLTLHTGGGRETRISFEGFSGGDELLSQAEELIGGDLSGVFVTFTGRLPAGVRRETALGFLRRLQARGARIAADSRSLRAEDLTSLRPYLIKPNAEEVSAYVGRPVRTPEAAARAAARFHAAGIEKAVVSLGADGAVLAGDEGLFRSVVPAICAVSTVGAGDSSIAAFLWAKERGLSDEEALRRMAAFGTAACLTPGTEPPRPEDARRIEKEIRSERIALPETTV